MRRCTICQATQSITPEQGPYGEAPRYPPGGQWQAQGAYSQQPAAGYPAIYQYAPPPTVRGRVHDAYPQVGVKFMF